MGICTNQLASELISLGTPDSVWAPSEANKQLIAAAPYLLDSLQWLVTCADPNGDAGIDIKALKHAIDRAKATIAKALG